MGLEDLPVLTTNAVFTSDSLLVHEKAQIRLNIANIEKMIFVAGKIITDKGPVLVYSDQAISTPPYGLGMSCISEFNFLPMSNVIAYEPAILKKEIPVPSDVPF